MPRGMIRLLSTLLTSLTKIEFRLEDKVAASAITILNVSIDARRTRASTQDSTRGQRQGHVPTRLLLAQHIGRFAEPPYDISLLHHKLH